MQALFGYQQQQQQNHACHSFQALCCMLAAEAVAASCLARFQALCCIPAAATAAWRLTQFANSLLDTTVDADKLYGYKTPAGVQTSCAFGAEEVGELYCKEAMSAIIEEPCKTFTLSGLVPGQDYFFVARGIADTGKGEFSEVLGPIRTLPEDPKFAEPAEVYYVDETSCSVFLRLPFDMGSRISEVKVVLNRTGGPLAAVDYNSETGDILDHIKQQVLVADPEDLRSFCTIEGDGSHGHVRW
eukprot:TRINITY_DN768_c0_g1_i3.p1 TRINITY_DN768_c0_g1~~TRINITY_DN768_c0_g1_i3.p1  ORF type:complete len:243 (-),score=71.92 TRINITY_DN768_c0_g1_i3:587-1315(-)